MYYDILDKNRKKITPLFKDLSKQFYLAGGTALALQLGHRDSLDFDFFTQKEFDAEKLFIKLQNIFSGYKLKKIQEEKNTLTILVDDKIKMSFFYYPYKLIKKPVKTENFILASIEDIGCMKLQAIVSRATARDYVDLYFILKRIKLEKLLDCLKKKLPQLEVMLALKGLVYFNDIAGERLKFKNNNEISFAEVKKFLKKEIKSLGY
jgi:predicted nucleotidyltransferase component of viral defense system